MPDVETQLERYGEAVEHAALVAALDGVPSDDEPRGLDRPGPSRTPLLAALAAVAFLLIGGAASMRVSEGGEVDTAGPAASDVEAEWSDYAVPAYLTDGVPVGMTAPATMSAADSAEPAWTTNTQMYWVDGQAMPLDGDHQLAISWFADDGSNGELFGDSVTVRGTDGVSSDGFVAFVDGGFQVWLSSPTFSTSDLIVLAEALAITESGVRPLDDVPGGLTALPVRRSSTYPQFGATVPFDGHTATYLDGDRELNIFTSPLDGYEQAFGWRAHHRQIEVDGRTVWISSDGSEFSPTTAVWMEGEAQIAVMAHGLTEEEIVAAIAGARPATRAEW